MLETLTFFKKFKNTLDWKNPSKEEGKTQRERESERGNSINSYYVLVF